MSGDNKGQAAPPALPPKDPSDAFPPDDTNYVKYYDFLVKELDRDFIKPAKYLSQLCELADMVINGAPLSDHHKNYFLETSLPKMVRNLIARRFKDEDDQYQLVCEFFLKVVDLVIFSLPYDRLGTWEAMFHVIDDTRRFYSIREEPEYVEFISKGVNRKTWRNSL